MIVSGSKENRIAVGKYLESLSLETKDQVWNLGVLIDYDVTAEGQTCFLPILHPLIMSSSLHITMHRCLPEEEKHCCNTVHLNNNAYSLIDYLVVKKDVW